MSMQKGKAAAKGPAGKTSKDSPGSSGLRQNGKNTFQGRTDSKDPKKKQRTEVAKHDRMGPTESQARLRRQEKKANETPGNEIHAENARTDAANKDRDRNKAEIERVADQHGDDVKNGNADDPATKAENMEVEEETPECSAGSDVTADESPKNVGDQQEEAMDTGEKNKNLEESQEDPLDRDNDVGGDEHDGNHDQQDPVPETPPPQDKIKGIKDKAASRSDKIATAESTKGAPDTKGTEGDHLLAKSLEQQQLDVRNTKRHQHQSEYQHHRDHEESGLQASYHHERTPDKRVYAQKDIQTQRSLQASKQMAYQVFANVLTAIEEQEYREAKNYKLAKPEKSEAFIPDQSWKKDDDVLAGVEAQLTVFQAHMGFCPKEVAEAAKVEMIDTTLYWAAARQEIGLPPTPTDRYAINLLEILYDGATSNTFQMLKESRKTFGRAELMENVGKIMAGQAKADHLDKQFRDDPRKEAKALPIRQGQNISDGIERLLKIAHDEGMNKGIRRHLKHHFETVSAR